ncbi:regulatory protein RecX [Nocardiopsis coralliicola]
MRDPLDGSHGADPGSEPGTLAGALSDPGSAAGSAEATADGAEGPVPDGSGTAPSGRVRDPEERARQICLRLLTMGPRTRAQLAEALHKHEIDEGVAAGVLDRLGEAGLIDDQAFAAAWVESRHTGRGLGRRVLAAELHRRGVDAETVRSAVDDISADTEEETARSVARRKLASTRGKDDATRVRRTMGVLARKGFPGGLAYRVIREELEAEGSDLDLPDPDLD